MLAPLFDRMTTHDLTRRFTPDAWPDEALEFFQNEYSKLSEEQLNHPVVVNQWDSSINCWDHIPSHLAEKWACHRTPPVPPSYPVLRWLCKRRPMEHVVPWIRWLLFSLVTFPRRVLKSLQTSFCALFLPKKVVTASNHPITESNLSYHDILYKHSINFDRFFPF